MNISVEDRLFNYIQKMSSSNFYVPEKRVELFQEFINFALHLWILKYITGDELHNLRKIAMNLAKIFGIYDKVDFNGVVKV